MPVSLRTSITERTIKSS